MSFDTLGLSVELLRAIREQVASAIDLIVHTERLRDGSRKVTYITEVQGMEGDIITMAEIFKFQRRGIDAEGNVVGQFQATGIVPKFNEHLRQRGIELDFDIFNPSATL